MQANLWGPVSVRGPVWENKVEGNEGTCMHTGKKESLYTHRVKKLNKIKVYLYTFFFK